MPEIAQVPEILEPLVDRLARLPDEQRRQALSELPPATRAAALYCWELWARADQLEPPGKWRDWLLQWGRGAGKTRSGAEWVRASVESERYRHIALVGRTWPDVRDVMVEGESGILAVSTPWFYPIYQPSRRLLVWPNGAEAKLYSAEEPDMLRGPSHDAAWVDELASWSRPEAFAMLKFCLRQGTDPRCVVTTTPRPTRLMRELVAKKTTVVTRATSYANRANLAPGYFEDIIAPYEGSRLGRQEIHGELLEDTPGALWNLSRLDELRVSQGPPATTGSPKPAPWKRVVIAVDPAVSYGENSDETGIIVAALGADGHCYVLADRSDHYPSTAWGRLVVSLYRAYKADRVVAEVNNGGDLVNDLLRSFDRSVPVRPVHASRGKYVRAEPVSALYDQGLIHHLGTFATLEDQMAGFTPDLDRDTQGSPDRVDALVWAITELMIRHQPQKATSRPLTRY
jgi:phage terminase large subunit-like protein